MNAQDEPNTHASPTHANRWQFTRLFRCFHMAIQPGKLCLALVLVLLTYLGGKMLDGLWGPQVLSGEFVHSRGSSLAEFDEYCEEQDGRTRSKMLTLLRRARIDYEGDRAIASTELYGTAEKLLRERRAELMDDVRAEHPDVSASRGEAIDRIDARFNDYFGDLRELRPRGVFETALEVKRQSVFRMAQASINPRTLFEPERMLDPVQDLIALGPWLWRAHSGFLIVYFIMAGLIWSILGGAIHRMAVVEAADGPPAGAGDALLFVRRRWLHYIFAPLTPLLIVLAIGAVMALVGWIVFNIPVLNVIGGILFVFALLAGFVMALLLVGWAAGVSLMYPALSAEGSEAFDAISRSYSYVFARPWRLLWYAAVSLVYGAATFMFVGLFMFLLRYVTQHTVGLGSEEIGAMMGQPAFGQLLYAPDFTAFEGTDKLTAIFVFVWMQLFLLLIAAYAVSLFISATSTIYLLVRHDCDGTALQDVYFEPEPRDAEAVEKVEPAPAAEASPTPEPPAAPDVANDQ